jgi:ABC-type transporter Mla subunit MlaD
MEPSRTRRRRRRRPLRTVAIVAAAVILFGVGIAVGEALRDNPKPNLTVTTTKTLIP